MGIRDLEIIKSTLEVFFCYLSPVLIVNELGIEEGMSTYSTGLINWEDIEDVTIILYMDNTYFIGILLKRP